VNLNGGIANGNQDCFQLIWNTVFNNVITVDYREITERPITQKQQPMIPQRTAG
jgi:hypothetical protein